MKKVLSLLMIVLLCAFVISACSGNTGEGDNHIPDQVEDTENNGTPNDEKEQGGDQEDIDQGNNQGDVGDELGNDGNQTDDPNGSVDDGVSEDINDELLAEIMSEIMEAVEQRPTMKLEEEMISDWYHLDPALLEAYSIHLPMFNISTNEVAILKVNDVNDLPAVEIAVKQRAEDVQKQFEQYLQDQYENAKNYKLVTKDRYVLFVIDNQETAEDIVQIFESYFEAN